MYSELNIKPMSQPVIPTDSPFVLKSLIEEAVRNFNNAYVEKYGKEDFGTCGSAVVLIKFGRKTKLRKELQADGFISDYWESKKAWAVNVPFVYNDVPSQNWAYREYRMVAVQKLLQKALPGFDIIVHSWCD